MEVNHDKLPALAALGLLALRSGSNTATGSLFVDCLQPRQSAAETAPPKSFAPADQATASEQPASNIKAIDDGVEEEEPDDSVDKKHEADEPETASQAAAVTPPQATVPPKSEADIAAAEQLDESLSNSSESAAEETDLPQSSPVVAIEPTLIAPEEPIPAPKATDAALPILASSDGKELKTDSTKGAVDKSKRGKARVQSVAAESIESSSEPDTDKSSGHASKPPVARPQRPETTVELGPPEVAPLDRSSADDGPRSKGTKEVIDVTADNKQPPAPDTIGPTPPPTMDPSASTPQTDASPVTGVSAATPKPPAAFLKSKATHADSDRPAGEIDPAKFLSRVVKAFESAQHRGSEVRLRLHPAELGALSIEIKVQDSVLTASVQTETSDAKAAIVDNLPALRERLADQGIRIDQFDVDLMDHSDRRQQFLDEQARQQEDRQPTPSRPATRRNNASQQPAPQPVRHRNTGSDGLNVII